VTKLAILYDYRYDSQVVTTYMGERTRELALLIIGDIFFFIAALWITLSVRYFDLPSLELFGDHVGPFLTLSTVWLFIFYIAGLYDKHTLFLKSLLLSRIINTLVANGIIAAILFLIIPFGIAPKTNLVIYLLVSVGLFIWWRMYLYRFIAPKVQHRAILLADGAEAIELVDEINNNDRYSYTFVRIIDAATAKKTPDFEEKLLRLLEKERIDIVVANSNDPYVIATLPKIFDLAFLRFEMTFLDFHKVYEDTFDRVPVGSIQYDWFITNISQSKNAVYTFFKRSLDVLFAILLLAPTMLLLPFVILAMKLEDRHGKILYTTTRIGQYNKQITIYKFRTKNGTDAGAAALKSTLVDTKVGSFLRKTRIDELPQLLNVLWGDLSFIGPRPEMPALVAEYMKSVPYYNARHFLKPGLSGWAQIKNFDVPRGGIDVERTKIKVSYDLYYLERRSLFLDLQIALKTIATIVMRTGT
jgi:lipopolysaccharide/colanic/teichoic acid biosynthesis glycosyltransferase